MGKVTLLHTFNQSDVNKATLHQLGDSAAALEAITPEELLQISVIDKGGSRVSGMDAVNLVIESLQRTYKSAKSAKRPSFWTR